MSHYFRKLSTLPPWSLVLVAQRECSTVQFLAQQVVNKLDFLFCNNPCGSTRSCPCSSNSFIYSARFIFRDTIWIGWFCVASMNFQRKQLLKESFDKSLLSCNTRAPRTFPSLPLIKSVILASFQKALCEVPWSCKITTSLILTGGNVIFLPLGSWNSLSLTRYSRYHLLLKCWILSAR